VILFDGEDKDAAAFTAARGAGINLVPVTKSPELSNQGDRVALSLLMTTTMDSIQQITCPLDPEINAPAVGLLN
jgi:hypothetical protein